ncbi:hypothetical protein SLS62_008547 [Diatrype stigma]|uniref:F5/8 type C domain-containing protein n=1 Tax=Diatrype stigma TaxID=117547 RepID=A0AAN9UIX1_9PEZI
MLWNFQVPGLACAGIILLSATRTSAQSFPWATAIPRTQWTVTADSLQAGNEPENVLDGNTSTIWHTQYSPTLAPLPHYIQVDMQKSYVVNGVSYQPRQTGGSNGNIGQHTVALSEDGETWAQVAYGTYLNDATTKRTFFSNATARYVRLAAQSEAQGGGSQWSSMAELNIYSPDPSLDGGALEPPASSAATLGRWETTVDLPLVPAAAALTPAGAVVLWSAYRPDVYAGGTGLTQTVVWDPAAAAEQALAPQTVTDTGHDMFCPGVALGADGRLVVMGGNDNRKTSTYDGEAAWSAGPPMNVGRGYQSAATLADGRIFTIGGSWSGGRFQKDGEIFDPVANTWTNATGCKTAPMLTADAQGVYRADNHAWLFAYKQNSVFHAGPSRNMNWYNTSSPTGSWKAAGRRGTDATDAMCGVAAMYDAAAGLILTAGGSPSYQNSAATRSAHRIALHDTDTDADITVTVTELPPMSHARAFGSAVVLPDGTVLVVGGQAYAVPFTDTTAALAAELFDPGSESDPDPAAAGDGTGTWRTLASVAVPRTYHSVALLLPDATVLAGGGGMCGKGCPQNHLDMQIFAPPYLFVNANSSNSGVAVRAARPKITSVLVAGETGAGAGAGKGAGVALKPGDALRVATSGPVASFSLVRHGSSTHTVNTDQRRVPLAATAAVVTGDGDDEDSDDGPTSYEMTLPDDPGVVLPGYWMLFAIDAAGVPSVATTVQVLLP